MRIAYRLLAAALAAPAAIQLGDKTSATEGAGD